MVSRICHGDRGAAGVSKSGRGVLRRRSAWERRRQKPLDQRHGALDAGRVLPARAGLGFRRGSLLRAGADGGGLLFILLRMGSVRRALVDPALGEP